MFSAISKNFAEGAGKESLIPIKSLEHAYKIKLLQIVVKKKKRHFIFWKKSRYFPYEFELNHVLLHDEQPMNVDITSQQAFCKWHRKLEFSLSGKVGADIMNELADIDISASDKVEIQADLGQIDLVKVVPSSLEKQLEKRRINLAHCLIDQIRSKDKSCVLCVVQSIAKLAGDADIKRVDDVADEANASANINIAPGTNINADGHLENSTSRDIGLVKGTPIAYKVWELQVSKHGGNIVPCIGEDIHGGFMDDDDIIGGPIQGTSSIDGHLASLEMDGAGSTIDGIVDSPDKVMTLLRHIHDLPEVERQKVNDVLLTASAKDIEKLDTLFNLVETRLKEPDGDKRLSLQSIKSLHLSEEEVCYKFLSLAGFEIENDQLFAPPTVTERFEACCHLMEAISELKEDVLVLIRSCGPELRPTLLDVIERFLQREPMVEFNRHVEALARDPVGAKLLEKLNIHADLERRNPLLPKEQRLADCVDELYWWLCAVHR